MTLNPNRVNALSSEASYLRSFPEEVYDLSDSSHVVRLVKTLCGDAGVGALRKQLLLSRLGTSLDTTNYLDLDRLFGDPMKFPRLDTETYDYLPESNLLSDAQWTEVMSKDASYRGRIFDYMRAFAYGGTLKGIATAAQAACGSECIVFPTRTYYEAMGVADNASASDYIGYDYHRAVTETLAPVSGGYQLSHKPDAVPDTVLSRSRWTVSGEAHTLTGTTPASLTHHPVRDSLSAQVAENTILSQTTGATTVAIAAGAKLDGKTKIVVANDGLVRIDIECKGAASSSLTVQLSDTATSNVVSLPATAKITTKRLSVYNSTGHSFRFYLYRNEVVNIGAKNKYGLYPITWHKKSGWAKGTYLKRLPIAKVFGGYPTTSTVFSQKVVPSSASTLNYATTVVASLPAGTYYLWLSNQSTSSVSVHTNVGAVNCHVYERQYATEGVDFVIDYVNGTITRNAVSSIPTGASVLASYTYVNNVVYAEGTDFTVNDSTGFVTPTTFSAVSDMDAHYYYDASAYGEVLIVPLDTPVLNSALTRSIKQCVGRLKPQDVSLSVVSLSDFSDMLLSYFGGALPIDTIRSQVQFFPIDSSSDAFSVLRYVTGKSDWDSGSWIVPNTQVEAPTQALALHQEEVFDVTSQAISIQASSNHIGAFNTTQTSLFAYLNDVDSSGDSALSVALVKRFSESFFGGRV